MTGATGFVGGQVARRFVECGHDVSCLVRSPAATPLLQQLGVTLTQGDLRDAASLTRGMAGCDWVINVAGAYAFWSVNSRWYRDVNVEGTRNVMEAALRASAAKVVHVSSVVVFGKPATSPVTEDVAPGPVRFSEYARTKYEGDLIAWRLYETRGLPLVMVYPAAVVGPADPKPTGDYIRNVLSGRMPATVFGDSSFSFVHVNDVAEGITRAAACASIGARYLLVGENLTFTQVNRSIAEIGRVPLPRVRMPDEVAIGLAALLTAIASISKKPPMLGLSLDMARTMRNGAIFDGRKAERELGLRYTPVLEALREAVESSPPRR